MFLIKNIYSVMCKKIRDLKIYEKEVTTSISLIIIFLIFKNFIKCVHICIYWILKMIYYVIVERYIMLFHSIKNIISRFNNEKKIKSVHKFLHKYQHNFTLIKWKMKPNREHIFLFCFYFKKYCDAYRIICKTYNENVIAIRNMQISLNDLKTVILISNKE